ncbi:MAG TPA: hypothetical protein VKY22_31270 [Bradyrhizobium sp.]|nr:hypothetical protein [Bradyrhizobium sp.]
MIKQLESEVETDWSRRKQTRTQGRFLKGPVPMKYIGQAAKLPGKALGVYIAIHHQAALSRKQWVSLPKGLMSQLGVTRDAKARALQQLEGAALVRVARSRGKPARISLIENHPSNLESINMSAKAPIWQNAEWTINNGGLSARHQQYFISIAQLDELRDVEKRIAMWPLQMAEKSWIEVESFNEAFEQALLIHKPEALMKLDLVATFEAARHIKDQRS